MARPEFSEILYNRRRELGISIEKAAYALRLKDRVLVAFEEGDWSSMPKSGYAQGMLSSYARYLGLDTREIADIFTRDFEEHQMLMGDDDNQLRGPDSTSVHSVRVGAARKYSGARGLLPTSGGYAGDMEDFSSVTAVRPHGAYGNYGSAQPTAGASSAQSVRLADSSYSDAEHRYTRARPSRELSTRSTRRGRSSQSDRSSRDSIRVEEYSDDKTASHENRQVRRRSGYRPRVPVEQEAPRSPRRRTNRDQVTTRRVNSEQYVDDLRYDDQAHPYEAASNVSGGRGYRSIMTPERPNVRRRETSRTRKSQAMSGSRSGGILGSLGDFTRQNERLVLIIAAVAAIILTVIIISSVGSCIRNLTSTGRGTTTVVEVEDGSADTGSDSGGSDDSKDSEGSGAQDGTSSTDSDAGQTTQTAPETKVEVTVAVADAGITWVEITNDGQTVVAETITGPWSGTYNVTRSMKIDVSEPSVVTVTRNGVTQTFDSKASGVGTITIEGPNLPDSSDDDTSSSTTSGQYTVQLDNGDGTWYDENWYFHDGEGGYYDNDGVYHEE